MMKKLQSLVALEELGLNTPKLVWYLNPLLEFEERKETWESFGKARRGDRVSIRTEHDSQLFHAPHFPNVVLNSKLVKEVLALMKNGYHIALFEAIDPDDCRLKGNLYLSGREDTKYRATVEYSMGKGTVRDVDRQTRPIKVVYLHLDKAVEEDGDLLLVYAEIIQKARHRVGEIFEFSIYNSPVGKLNSPIIFWEMRPWK